MSRTWWPRREIAVLALLVALSFVAASLAGKLTRPPPFANAAMGAEWRCDQAFLIVTICVRNTDEERQPSAQVGDELTS